MVYTRINSTMLYTYFYNTIWALGVDRKIENRHRKDQDRNRTDQLKIWVKKF
jgi:hypothetical protein